MNPSLVKKVSAFVRDAEGATAIEYALIAVLIAVVIVGVVSSIGTHLNSRFQAVSSSVAR